MIRPETEVILSSGEALSAAEIFEGLVRLSRVSTPFPLLSERDRTQAVVLTAFDALEWVKEREL